MRHSQQHPFWNQNCYLIAQFHMYAKVQDLGPVIWNICFLETPMSREEYIRIHSKYFPTDIRDQYHIDGLIAACGYLYIKIIKGIYGIKQAYIISYNNLISHMDPHGYYPGTFIIGLWEQKTRKNIASWMILEWNIYQRWCKSSYKFPKKALCNFNILVGLQLPQIDNILEL